MAKGDVKVNYRNIPRFLLLLLGALMISLIMMERLELSRPMGAPAPKPTLPRWPRLAAAG